MSTRMNRLLLAMTLLQPVACAQPEKAPESTPGEPLDRLIALSRSAERSEWWPAVQRLGRIARTDAVLRAEIWNRAKVNTLGMKFVSVTPATFTMGPDWHRVFDLQQPHDVKITRPYYMAVAEVTNAQVQQLFPKFEADVTYSPDPDSPAVRVSWKDADQFCKLLSKSEGVAYRLPTEAEWEYACRAGTTSRYCFGDGLLYKRAQLSEYAWWDYANGRASEVALLKPNNWGIYDMHGNAFEWVADWHSHFYYAECAETGTVEDPKGPEHGRAHVLRGGGWQVRNHLALTSTARFPLPRFDRRPFQWNTVGMRQTIGFRMLREVSKR